MASDRRTPSPTEYTPSAAKPRGDYAGWSEKPYDHRDAGAPSGGPDRDDDRSRDRYYDRGPPSAGGGDYSHSHHHHSHQPHQSSYYVRDDYRDEWHRDAYHHDYPSNGGGGGGGGGGGYRGEYRDYYREYAPRHGGGGGGGGGPRGYDDYYERRRVPQIPGPRHVSRPPIRGSEEDRKKSTTLWVGNLPYSYKEEDVLDLFDRFGPIAKVTVPIDRYTTKNKGFAFVQFESRRDGEDAYEHFYGQSIEGRRVKVDWDVGLGIKAGAETFQGHSSQGRGGGGRSPGISRRYSPVPLHSRGAYDTSPVVTRERAYSPLPPPRGGDYSPRKM